MSGWLDEFIATERLPADFARTIWAAAEPLVRLAVEAWAAKGGRVVVGICGSQASGKSTLSVVVARLLADRGLKAAILSLDDIYLPRDERIALAAEVHPLLRTRGVPGTHDVELGEAVLEGLGAPGMTLLPRFDKAQDTRRPPGAWEAFAGPADVVLFEGWCVGAWPQPLAALERPVNVLERDEDPDGRWRAYANEALAGPYRRLFDRIDVLALLAAPGFETVFAWRCEQEAKLRERAPDAPGLMSEGQVGRFIAHYERITRHILNEMPGRADLTILLDRDRRVQAVDEN